MNAFEKAIAYLSPGVAARRATDRFRLARVNDALSQRGYEGAARGRRTDNWKTSGRDANAEITPALSLLRNRSRDLRRNNPYAEAAISGIVDNVIGYGIKPKPKGRTQSVTKRSLEAWKAHAETKAIDYDGESDIYGLEALAFDALVESGAVLARRRLLTSAQMKAKGATLPFQIQLLEPDHLDHTKHGMQANGDYDLRGIRFSATGGVTGYWLFDTHPGAGVLNLSPQSKFVPERDVIHTFRKTRPGQVLGVPWASPCLIRMFNFDEVEDAYREREKVAACFAAFITGLDAETAPKKIELAERLEPGMISFAPPGSQVTFGNPPSVNGYKDFASINLHAIAAGFGVPYELFGDLSQVNFTSGRMGWQNFQRKIDRWTWQMFVPNFCDKVWSWFNSSMQFAGIVAEDCPCVWVPPRRLMVNPKEEIGAKKDEIRNGLSTWQQAVTELGYDAAEQAAEIAEANALLDSLGLKLDCDPRFALPAGSAGETAGGGGQGQSNKPTKEGT